MIHTVLVDADHPLLFILPKSPQSLPGAPHICGISDVTTDIVMMAMRDATSRMYHQNDISLSIF